MFGNEYRDHYRDFRFHYDDLMRAAIRQHLLAAAQLKTVGHQTLNLRGGMMGWQSAGFPIKKGK